MLLLLLFSCYIATGFFRKLFKGKPDPPELTEQARQRLSEAMDDSGKCIRDTFATAVQLAYISM